MQQRTSGRRSRRSVTWRWVWPPETGTSVQPISSAPAHAKPTGEQPVSVGVVADGPRAGAGAAKGTGAHLGPDLQVGAE